MVQKLICLSHRDGKYIRTLGLEVSSLKHFFTFAEANLNLKWFYCTTFLIPRMVYDCLNSWFGGHINVTIITKEFVCSTKTNSVLQLTVIPT